MGERLDADHVLAIGRHSTLAELREIERLAQFDRHARDIGTKTAHRAADLFAFGDVVWISVAFALGLLSRMAGLPPLVGFLATGFLLNIQGIATGEILEKLADLGITLLLFTVGLKLDVRTLARP